MSMRRLAELADRQREHVQPLIDARKKARAARKRNGGGSTVSWFSRRIPRIPVTVPGQMTTVGLGCWAVVFGALTAVGGYARWASPVYTVLKETPGGPYTWGFTAMMLGLCILAGVGLQSWAFKGWSLAFLAIWSVSYGLGAASAAYQLPGASLGSGPTIMFIGYLSAVLIMLDHRLGNITTREPQ